MKLKKEKIMTILLLTISLLIGFAIVNEYVKITERRKRHLNQYHNIMIIANRKQ